MREYTAYDFYLLRAPLLPVQSLFHLNAVMAKKVGNEQEIRAIFADPLFVEAVYLASKDLHSVLCEWLEGKLTDQKRVDKLIKSLHKYYSRMCTRCTPYGLFAGCATGLISEAPTDIRLGAEKLIRHSRFDMSFSAELGRYFSTLPAIQQQIKFYPNNTAYKAGGRFRFVEYNFRNKKRYYTLSGIAITDYTSKAFEQAAAGATMAELANGICALDNTIQEERALQFIHQLIQTQFLVSEFVPIVTGKDFYEVMIDKLQPYEGTADLRTALLSANATLNNAKGGLSDYLSAEKQVTHLMPRKNMDIIQTDLFLGMEQNNLTKRVVDEIVEAAGKLYQLCGTFKIPEQDEFKSRFAARYEEREVPLAEALDADTGVGYALAVTGNVEHMPLLNNIALPSYPSDRKYIYDDMTKLAYLKVKQYLKTGDFEVMLTDEELDELIAQSNIPGEEPFGGIMFGSLQGSSAEEIDKGNYRFICRHLNTPHPAKLFARFSHADEALADKLRECLKQELQAYPDALIAEIVHLPEDRLGNVLIRPVLRDYEIPYLCNSSLPEQQQLPVSDLMISLRGGRIFLRSKKHNKEVIPRLTNAHNASRGLPLYRFLCDLAIQNIKAGFLWEWKIFSAEPFLPRVTYKKIVLTRARWLLPKLGDEVTDGEQHIMEWKKKYNVPRQVLLHEEDNELLIDFDNPVCIHHLLQKAKKTKAILYEFLAVPENCFLQDAQGHYNTEMLIPVVKKKITPIYPPLQKGIAAIAQSMPVRSFLPGSEWLYVKLYAANKEMEALLLSVIKPLAEELMQQQTIDQWFFIRYYDPESHIRIRFHQQGDPSFWLTVLQQLEASLKPWQEQGLVARMMADTYVREIERYGSSTMELSEKLFCADSIAVADFLDLIEGEEGEEIRWQVGLYSIHRLLEDFGYTAPDKSRLMASLQKGFFNEFNNNRKENETRLARSLNDKYRLDYPTITALLDTPDKNEEIQPALDCFKRRSMTLQPIVQEIKLLMQESGNQPRQMDRLLGSYIHMAMNRLFMARQRTHELTIYHYLDKYYDSWLKRKDRTTPQKSVYA